MLSSRQDLPLFRGVKSAAKGGRYATLRRCVIKQGDKERSLARCKAILCHLALRHLGMTGAEVGIMTALTPSGVTRAARRGEALLLEDERLRGLVGL